MRQPFRIHAVLVGSLTCAVVLVISGCAPKQASPRPDLRATDTAGRVPALVDAAGQEDDQTLGELIHNLSHDDAAVRLFAIQALHQRTGQTLGYRYYESGDRRRAAVQRWHDWLDQRSSPDPAATAEPTPN